MHAIIRFLVSLKLTVVLLGFSVALVFFGTLDQVETGIHVTQKKYFESLFVIWHWPDTWAYQDVLGSFALPLPGGYTVGGLLLINLIAAHIHRFQFTLKKFGIQLVHAGLILLLFSELFTDILSVETMMSIPEDGANNVGTNARINEIAFSTDYGDDQLKVVTIPTEHLKAGDYFSHQELPFDVEIIRYHENAQLGFRGNTPEAPVSIATAGIGMTRNMPRDITVTPVRPRYGCDGFAGQFLAPARDCAQHQHFLGIGSRGPGVRRGSAATWRGRRSDRRTVAPDWRGA